MKGRHAFHPKTGVKLGDERYYPGDTPLRAPLDGSGNLTNGTLVAQSNTALARHFTETHQEHHEPDGELYSVAANAIRRLRQEDPWDCWLWYALAEHLARRGDDVGWMYLHVLPRCPRCSSALQFKEADTGHPKAVCASRCGAESHSNRGMEVRDRIRSLYAAAFEEIDELRTLRRA